MDFKASSNKANEVEMLYSSFFFILREENIYYARDGLVHSK